MRGTAVVGNVRKAQTVALLEMGVCSSPHSHGTDKPILCACSLLSSSNGLMGKDLHAFVRTLYVRSIA